MNRFLFLACVVLTALGSQQCFYRIEHDRFGTGGVLGVNSLYTPDSVWSFDLFLTLAVLDTSDYERIPDPDIRIFADQELVPLSITREGNRFFTDYYPEHGVEYRVEIAVPGHPVLSAETRLGTPASASLNSFSKETVRTEWGGEYYPLSLSIEDPVNQTDIYDFRLEAQGNYTSDYRDTTVLNTRWGIHVFFFSGDNVTETRTYQLEQEDGSIATYNLGWEAFEFSGFEEVDYRIEVQQYGPEFITYLNSVVSQRENESNPYTQPTQVYANVVGGLGIIDGFNRIWLDLEE